MPFRPQQLTKRIASRQAYAHAVRAKLLHRRFAQVVRLADSHGARSLSSRGLELARLRPQTLCPPQSRSRAVALFRKKSAMPSADEALPGRDIPLAFSPTHFVSGNRIAPPFPAGLRGAVFGMGCFWGAERLFWQLPGVYST